jgi:hypothetical protein
VPWPWQGDHASLLKPVNGIGRRHMMEYQRDIWRKAPHDITQRSELEYIRHESDRFCGAQKIHDA